MRGPFLLRFVVDSGSCDSIGSPSTFSSDFSASIESPFFAFDGIGLKKLMMDPFLTFGSTDLSSGSSLASFATDELGAANSLVPLEGAEFPSSLHATFGVVNGEGSCVVLRFLLAGASGVEDRRPYVKSGLSRLRLTMPTLVLILINMSGSKCTTDKRTLKTEGMAISWCVGMSRAWTRSGPNAEILRRRWRCAVFKKGICAAKTAWSRSSRQFR